MRIAAAIFGIAATAYLGWLGLMALTSGIRWTWGVLLALLFASALLVQAYGLWHETKGARLGGLICAIIVAATSLIIIAILAFPDLPNSFRTSLPPPIELWPWFGAFLAVAVAFTVAAVSIATSKHAP